MTPDAMLRLSNIRGRVIRATYEAFREDGSHKSSEAATDLTLSLPNMFEADERPTWMVSVYSYVVGDSRSHSWSGATVEEALAKAEEAIAGWCRPYEMKAMERVFGENATQDEVDF